jgi:hypothetical protein
MDWFALAVLALMLAIVPSVIRNWRRQWNDIKSKPSEDRAKRRRGEH